MFSEFSHQRNNIHSINFSNRLVLYLIYIPIIYFINCFLWQIIELITTNVPIAIIFFYKLKAKNMKESIPAWHHAHGHLVTKLFCDIFNINTHEGSPTNMKLLQKVVFPLQHCEYTYKNTCQYEPMPMLIFQYISFYFVIIRIHEIIHTNMNLPIWTYLNARITTCRFPIVALRRLMIKAIPTWTHVIFILWKNIFCLLIRR